MARPLPAPTPALDGAVLVRVPASGPGWAGRLPTAPDGTVLTVSLGDPVLRQVPVDDLIAGGYRLVGGDAAPAWAGEHVDVLVPAAVREGHPAWFARLQGLARRVFDLRMGPVRAVLADELAWHLAPQA